MKIDERAKEVRQLRDAISEMQHCLARHQDWPVDGAFAIMESCAQLMSAAAKVIASLRFKLE